MYNILIWKSNCSAKLYINGYNNISNQINFCCCVKCKSTKKKIRSFEKIHAKHSMKCSRTWLWKKVFFEIVKPEIVSNLNPNAFFLRYLRVEPFQSSHQIVKLRNFQLVDRLLKSANRATNITSWWFSHQSCFV